MRFWLFILVVLAAIIGIRKSAEAQSYPWCAYYNMGGFGGGGATNCGFATWQQCQAAISGVGGLAEPIPCTSPHAECISRLGPRIVIAISRTRFAATASAAWRYWPRFASLHLC